MKKRFIIIDGSSLMYRAFYALPLLSTSSGVYTNAIHGFIKMLAKLIDTYQPTHLAVALDRGKNTFRTALYADYKGTRKETPVELSTQFPLLQEFLDAAGIQAIGVEGYEADDILGTLANRAVNDGAEAYIVTGDRDALQLIRQDLHVLYTKKGISNLISYDETLFREEYGLEPIQLIDVKALMGDVSDNIPGVPGIGQKTAIRLLQAYHTVEEIYQNIESISGKKLCENLVQYKEQAFLSKTLATIHSTMDISLDNHDLCIHPEEKRLQEFYKRLEMKGEYKAFVPYMQNVETADNGEKVGFTTNFTPKISLTVDENVRKAFTASVKEAGYLSLAIHYGGRVPTLLVQEIYLCTKEYVVKITSEELELFAELLEDASIVKILSDYKAWLEQVSLPYVMSITSVFDMTVVAYLLEPTASDYKVESLVEKYLSIDTVDEKTLTLEERYIREAYVLEKLYPLLREKLGQEHLAKLYEEMELPLIHVLAKMEQRGIHVNQTALADATDSIGQVIKSLEDEIYTLAEGAFNLNSPKQMQEVLFDRLSIIPPRNTPKTKNGYSTNAEVLESICHLHPVVEKILSYRMWMKLKSTYLEGLKPLIHPVTHRLHTSFNQTVTATGRLSSSAPNLQNIPIRTEEGRKIRSLFEPADGYTHLLSVDYSQIELRILAHLSEDENFVHAFTHDEDIHARTASEVFDIPIEEVTSEQRRHAKAVNFGIVYGISDYGLSRDLHISRDEAARYIASYFEKCKGVKSFIDTIVEGAHEKGYVTTLFGRKRSLPAIRSKNFNQRMLAERMAMNTPIQGTAADIIKLAMIQVEQRLTEGAYKSRILLQVHDELVLETVADEIDEVSHLLQDTLEHIVELRVPLSVDIHVGKNWAEAK